jgi:hypothetical protein
MNATILDSNYFSDSAELVDINGSFFSSSRKKATFVLFVLLICPRQVEHKALVEP